MMRGLILLMMVAVLAAGCQRERPVASRRAATEQSSAPAPSAAPQAAPDDRIFVTAKPPVELKEEDLPPAPTQAQPKLQTLKLYVGTNEITAEVALTPIQVQTGMMWRTNMAEMDGMLFVFRVPHRASFWMRNTLLPLTCAYIDPSGTILEVRDMKPKDLSSVQANSDQVQYVLEMNQGWFGRHGVGPGAVIRTDRGSFAETFFKTR